MKQPRTDSNRPEHAGRQASDKVLFGEHSRYAVYAVHTRFDAVSWFVADAWQSDDETGMPGIIRQESSFQAAIKDL